MQTFGCHNIWFFLYGIGKTIWEGSNSHMCAQERYLFSHRPKQQLILITGDQMATVQRISYDKIILQNFGSLWT